MSDVYASKFMTLLRLSGIVFIWYFAFELIKLNLTLFTLAQTQTDRLLLVFMLLIICIFLKLPTTLKEGVRDE